tara:strand:- start:1920 stop:2456 length:537 start_codon:yes stop_codon:yes gene_type:complete
MKKLITILLLLLTLVSYSQTELDMLTFNALNEYRVEHGVKPLIFDSTVWGAAQHHSTYLSDNGYPDNYVCSSGHHELELVEFTDRLRYYGVKWGGTAVECVTSWGGNRNDEENAIHVINQWDSSPSHKEGMLEKDVTRVGISLVSVSWNCDMSYTYKGEVITDKFTCVKYFATLLLVR